MDQVEAQWLQIIEDSRKRIYAYVRRVARNGDDFDDLVSETITHAWVDRDEICRCPCPTEQVLQHAREACGRWRTAQRREVAATREDVFLPVDGGASISLDEAIARREWSEALLARLPMKQRLAADFTYRWNWPPYAVAIVVGCSESTLRVHLFRARRRLRQLVEKQPVPWAQEEGNALVVRRYSE